MIREQFIDFLTEEETLAKFKTNERGVKFRKATPKQIVAVILVLLKSKTDRGYYYGDVSKGVMTHRIIRLMLNKYKETNIQLSGKDSKLTDDIVYSILKGFSFFNPNKTKDSYSMRGGMYYIDNEHGKRFNNWRIYEDKLCSFLGWEGDIYEPAEPTIEERVMQLEEKVEQLSEIVADFETTTEEIHSKMLEVLTKIYSSTKEERDGWVTFFTNAKEWKGSSKGDKENAEAAINTINQYNLKFM